MQYLCTSPKKTPCTNKWISGFGMVSYEKKISDWKITLKYDKNSA